MKEKTKKTSARDFLENVAPNLYRHSGNSTYYGLKKVNGNNKTHALGTTDRKTADRLLRDWIGGLESADVAKSDMTLDMLLAKFIAVRVGMAPGTLKNEASMIKVFRATFPKPMTALVARVTTADIKEWLAAAGSGCSGSYVNHLRQFLAKLFKLAVDARVIGKANNPFDLEAVPAKKNGEVKRPIPSDEEFAKIVEEIRNPGWKAVTGKRGGQRPMHFHESADFIEFEGRAGVGQAEAAGLEWEHIGAREMKFTRKKTGAVFFVPIFSDVRAILDRVRARRRAELGGDEPTGRVFDILDGKKALEAAVRRLGLRHYTQRNFRSMCIVKALARGVDVKQIAMWQGHRDGGALIMRVYSEVIRGRADQRAYEDAQIARMEGKVVEFPGAHKAA